MNRCSVEGCRETKGIVELQKSGRWYCRKHYHAAIGWNPQDLTPEQKEQAKKAAEELKKKYDLKVEKKGVRNILLAQLLKNMSQFRKDQLLHGEFDGVFGARS